MKQLNIKFILFSLIGVFNTLFDIVLYLILLRLTHSILWANVAATSAALIGSYILNSRITFKAKRWTAKTFVGFVAVTVFGLWVLQTGLIFAFTDLLNKVPDKQLAFLGHWHSFVFEVLPKLVATGFTFIWNFVWYSKVIFRNASAGEAAVLAIEDS